VNGPNDQLGRSKTRREFIEDVHIELSQHLSVRPDNEPRTQHSKYIYNPLPAQRDIQKILSIVDYPRLNRVTDLEAPKSQDHPHYGGLGALGDFDNALVLFSYERQCLSDPQNCSYYLECLEGIATGRNSADLQEEVAKAMSLGLHTRKQIEEAYSFLNIDPSKNIPDEYVIGIYENRIESSPLQADEARQCLLIIGEARQSSKIQAKANNREMDLDQALEFLGVDINTDSDSIEAAAVALVSIFVQCFVKHMIPTLVTPKNRADDKLVL
jgi:ubiquitin carboxyl-terminal hydrolase 25/28